MALLYCRSCGGRISDQAASCPHCRTVITAPPAPTSTLSPLARWFFYGKRFPGWFTTLSALAIVAVNIASFVFFLLLNFPEPSHAEASLGAPRSITTPDGQLRLQLPARWVEGIAPPGSVYFAQDPDSYAVLFVYCEPKSDLVDLGPRFQQLETYSEELRTLLARNFTEGAQSPLGFMKIGGYPACQGLVTGTVEGTPLEFLHTVIELPDHYYQVRLGSPRDDFSRLRGEFEATTRSVEFLQP